jgi:hypothetical protein
MKDDPLLSYFGHPRLPAGYNSWENDGDEINGAGVNEPIWPVLFDTFEGLEVLIITEEMLAVFDTACPDYVVPRENMVASIGAEDQHMAAGNAWPELLVAGQSNVIVLPRDPNRRVIRKWDENVAVPSPDPPLPVAAGNNVRKAGRW